MATQPQNLSREMAHAYLTGTAPRTNPLSCPACQQFMTLIMQNKPNLPDAQMNVTSTITKDYESTRLRGPRKNKPNQTQPVVSLSNLFHPHRLYAYFNFMLWDVVRRKLCSVTV